MSGKHVKIMLCHNLNVIGSPKIIRTRCMPKFIVFITEAVAKIFNKCYRVLYKELY